MAARETSLFTAIPKGRCSILTVSSANAVNSHITVLFIYALCFSFACVFPKSNISNNRN